MSPMEPIAIVGMAGRFPGAADVDEFWRNLRDGVESISTFSDEELLAAGWTRRLVRHPQLRPGPARRRRRRRCSTPRSSAISPREAEIIDPQQRLFLECAWEALEHAGYDPRRVLRRDRRLCRASA